MLDLPITYRGVVYPWQCDHMGHMNVMWCVGKFDEATWQFFSTFGLTPVLPAGTGSRHGRRPAKHHIQVRASRGGCRIDTVRSPGDEGEGHPVFPRDAQRRDG